MQVLSFKQELNGLATFDYYLDAYWYCVRQNIDPAKIERVSFRSWSVVK